ncbi:MAG: hypothetical protein HYZ54_06495 [Ignavibacteriae bacterium]|nr:hypothetical protein [Ignavibacteriota bacterium]
MRFKLYCFITVLVFAVSASIAQTPNGKIIFSSNSANPPGMYSVSSLGADTAHFLYPSYYLKNVLYGSYPVVSPDGTQFARFESTNTAQTLIIRSVADGTLKREEVMTDYASNLQWTPQGSLVYETISTQGVNNLRVTNAATGVLEQILELKNQYYPQSNPGGGSVVLSADGQHYAYIRPADAQSAKPGVLMPWYARIGNYPEPCFPPHHSGTVNGHSEEKILLAVFPAPPQTIRHMALSSDGTILAMLGTVSFERPFPSDTSKRYTISKTGIICVSLVTYSINVIYETKEFYVEHPDNLFFSPTQPRLAFSIILGGKRLIMTANPNTPNNYSQNGEGEFIVGQTSVQNWALNPWSSDGQKLLYKKGDALWTMPPCGDGSKFYESVGKQLFIQDAQWAETAKPDTPPEITIVNPMPKLINNGESITNDFERRIRCKDVTKGITADGAAKIMILVKLPTPEIITVIFSLRKEECASGVTGIPDEDGSISDVWYKGASTYDKTLNPSTQTSLGNYATVIYHAPLNFTREGTEDNLLTERTVTLSVFIDELRYDIPIRIVRPVVALLHGVWSNAELWDNFAPLRKIKSVIHDTTGDPRFITTAIDYFWKCTKPVKEILKGESGVFNKFDEVIRERNKDFATVRADIICHSLGGIVSRSMPYYFPTRYFENTYGQGKIHKLVTNDSPHLGSELCSWLYNDWYNSSPVTRVWIDKMFGSNAFDRPNYPGDPISGGAVKDVQVGSPFLKDLLKPEEVKFQPPIHTVVSIASAAQVSENESKISKVAIAVLFNLANTNFFDVFGSQKHDLVVSESSQRAVSIFDNEPTRATYFNDVTHSTGFELQLPIISDESQSAVKEIDLLNAPVNSPLFSTNGIKFSINNDGDSKQFFIHNEDNNKSDAKPTQAVVSSSALNFSSPLNGSKIEAGSTVTLGLQASSGVKLSKIILSAFSVMAVDSTEPFEFQITIPANSALGAMHFYAAGFDSSGVAIDKDSLIVDAELILNVTSNTNLDSMIVATEQRPIIYMDEEFPLSVIGCFSDGVRRQISWDSATTYNVINTSTATVSQGSIIPHAVGTTDMIISRNNFSDTLHITVVSNNQAPRAQRGFDTTITKGTSLSLDASMSRDDDGDTLFYIWSIKEKPSASQVSIINANLSQARFTPDISGWYELTLAVQDSKGKSDTSFFGITVKEPVAVNEQTVNANTETRVSYSASNETIEVYSPLIEISGFSMYDVIGRTVFERYISNYPELLHPLTLSGVTLNSGIYYYVLQGKDNMGKSIRKMDAVPVIR